MAAEGAIPALQGLAEHPDEQTGPAPLAGDGDEDVLDTSRTFFGFLQVTHDLSECARPCRLGGDPRALVAPQLRLGVGRVSPARHGPRRDAGCLSPASTWHDPQVDEDRAPGLWG
jgi:hypothetical protein